MGATNPLDSAPGTIRGDFALVLSENIVHGSDSPESAARELPLYFARRRAPARGGMTLVLASRSPQRRAILTQLGLEFRVVEPAYDELPLPLRAARAGRARTASARPARSRPARGDGARRRHARRDRRPGARQARGRSRGGADAGAAGRSHARRRLRPDAARRLGSARVMPAPRCASGRSTQPTIDEYVARGEWRGRAGAYAIQEAGAALVSGSRELLQRRRTARRAAGGDAGRAPSPRFRLRSRIALHPGAFARLAPGSANPQ